MIKKWLDSLTKDDTGDLLTKSFSFLLIRVGGTIITFLFTYYVSRKFGADVYGLVALGFSVFLIASVLGRLGLDLNIVKYFSLNKEKEDAGLFYVSILKSFFLSSIIAGLLLWKTDFLVLKVFKEPKPELVPYLYWIIPSIPFWSVTLLCASLLRAKEMNNWFGFFNNSSRFTFTVILLLIFTYFSSDPLVVVKAHFYAVLIICIGSFTLASTRLKTINLKPKTNSWGFIKDSLPMMYSSSILVILGWIGTFIMGIYRESDEVGIYNVAVKVATLLNFCLQAINSILAPKIANKFAAGEKESYQRLITFSTKLNATSSILIGLIILLFSKEVLGFFGEEYKAGSTLLLVLCVGQLINSFSGSVGIVLQMTGKQVVYQYLMMLALVVNLILMFSLTPIYGGYGAAIASITSMILWNIGGAIYLKRKLNITTYFMPFSKFKS